MSLSRRLMAEFIGTFWLVLGGCGSAVLAAGFPKTGIGFLGVALAFGLTLLTMAYAIGHISGCHINPAVSVGLWAGGRFPASEVIPYIIAQVIGGIVAAGVLYVIASGTAGFDLSNGFASNGYGAHSPGGYGLGSAAVCEVVMTLMFLFVIMGATDKRVPAGFAPIPIGLVSDADSSHQHPGDQHLREPGAQHGSRALRRRLGYRAAMAVLAGSDGGRGARRNSLPGDCFRAGGGKRRLADQGRCGRSATG